MDLLNLIVSPSIYILLSNKFEFGACFRLFVKHFIYFSKILRFSKYLARIFRESPSCGSRA
nr:MAG TPA: Geminivirus AC4/5 conserved region [Caudoviricetes sp.]